MWSESGCNRWNDFNNFYIAAGFDLNLKAIFKNNDKLWNDNYDEF